MKQIILEKIVISPFPPVNKRCLWLNGSIFRYWYNGAWRTVDSDVEINNEYIDQKVSEVVETKVPTISETVVEKVVADAPKEMDTFKEVADQIEDINKKMEELAPTTGGWTEVE